MNFLNLPFDMQLQILKYNPRFRAINKQYYHDGYHVYIQYYKNKKITLDEILNYRENYYLYKFDTNEMYYFNPKKSGYYINLLTSHPVGIDPNFYSTNLTVKYITESYYNTYTYKKTIYQLKSPFYIDRDTMKNMMINRNIPGKEITVKIPKLSSENDYSKMYSKIAVIIYLSSIDKVNKLLNKQFKFKLGNIVENIKEYHDYMKELDIIIEGLNNNH